MKKLDTDFTVLQRIQSTDKSKTEQERSKRSNVTFFLVSLDDRVLEKEIGKDNAEALNTAAFIASPERIKGRRREETIENKVLRFFFLSFIN